MQKFPKKFLKYLNEQLFLRRVQVSYKEVSDIKKFILRTSLAGNFSICIFLTPRKIVSFQPWMSREISDRLKNRIMNMFFLRTYAIFLQED